MIKIVYSKYDMKDFYAEISYSLWHHFCALLLTVNNGFAETPTQEEIQQTKKMCNQNNVNVCAGLGLLYARGQEGIKQDYFKAKEYWKKCSLNDGGGCSILGALYYDGMGVKQDKKKAKECDFKSQVGCDAYAELNK